MNEDQLSEIETTLGVTYPTSFRSRIGDFLTLFSTPDFRSAFPDSTLLLSVPEIVEERERTLSTLLPFMREEQPQWPDTYAFNLDSEGPEYPVVVWSYADPMIVESWDGFITFYQWLCERVAINEHRNA